MSKKAVVLLSGGLDSATCLAIAKSEGFECYALSFAYGQRNSCELKASGNVAASIGVADHVVIDIDLRKWGGSALTDDIEVPDKADIDDKRESLSYKLKKILEIEAKKVLCSDAYIKDENFISPEELISASDVVIVGIPHGKYADLIVGDDKVLVDIWNFYGKGGFPR